MQRELNAELDPHPGKTAEETYAERISTITLAMQAGQDGRTVVNGLLARCLLWVEIVEEKYVPQLLYQLLILANKDPPIGEVTSTNASKTPLTNSSKSATPSTK
jgi:hypothetical protein